jgi:hypothetical protein
MCPPPSLVKRFISVETTRLGSKFAAFSIITMTTSTTSRIADAGAQDEDVDVDSESSSTVASRPLVGQRAVVKQSKVHGPGLALPMAS